MQIALNIKSNALDSLNESLAKYEQGVNGTHSAFKFAILHLSHCAELLFKMYLQTHDPHLVFTRCYREVEKRAKKDKVSLVTACEVMLEEGVSFEEKIKGVHNPHTVTMDMALNVAKCEVCQITENLFVDADFVDDVNWMKGLRNQIEHYQFSLSVVECRIAIGRIVRGLAEFADIFSLMDLEAEIGKDNFHVYQEFADEYEASLAEAKRKVEEAKAAAYRGVRPKEYDEVFWDVLHCPDCEQLTMIPDADSDSGFKCIFCENEESEEIEVDCDICGQAWPNGEMTAWEDTYDFVCPRCNNPEEW